LKSHFSAISHLEDLQLQLDKFSACKIGFIYWWKLVYRVCFNNLQNDVIYRCVWQSKSVVSVLAISCARILLLSLYSAVSKLGYTNLIFFEPRAKINRQYYWDMLLMQELLPVICSIAGESLC